MKLKLRTFLDRTFLWRCGPARAMASSFLRFLDHTQRRITVGRIPLDEWSARRTYLYLATHNTHNRQTSMPTVRLEPTISAGERPQTYALVRAAVGTGFDRTWEDQIFWSERYEASSGRLANGRLFAVELLSKPLLHGAGKGDRAQVQGRLVSSV